MTQLFRSKSCVLDRRAMLDSPPSPSSLYLSESEYEEEEEEVDRNRSEEEEKTRNQQFPLLALLIEALRKSLVTCSVDTEDICAPDIGWPTDVKHVSHVTFDRFDGFLGLPVEFQPQLPTKVPSASVFVFGVSAESMQCSYDQRGNCVPTILLEMQKHLYSKRGLEAEGIFRINAENSQEEYVRDQLNRGLVPHDIDVHCLSGLIKAWFRELPKGVLDSLTPDQVMQCNTEEEFSHLVSLLPPMEAALLGWAINLMADVVQHEHENKMNARNIAMVFAPNMTKMADPLTALLHAVQVMNFLKTLILKTLREREESAAVATFFSPCSYSPDHKDDQHSSMANDEATEGLCEPRISILAKDRTDMRSFLSSSPTSQLESDAEDSYHGYPRKGESEDEPESTYGNTTPVKSTLEGMGNEVRDRDRDRDRDGNGDVEGFSDRLSWRKGVKKLCRHPVFQLSKPSKKPAEFGSLNTGAEGGEACV